MRLIALLLLALPATAAPWVRWIDKKGDVHREELAEVVEDSLAQVTVRGADGKRKVIPMARVLTLVREDVDDPEQHELFDARFDVAAGLRLDAAREKLDRLAAKGSKPWIREYAAAVRLLLAEKRNEKDVVARAKKFLEEHPRSRFVPALLRLNARVESVGAGDPLSLLKESHEAMVELNAQFVERFGSMVDGALMMYRVAPDDFRMFIAGAWTDMAGRVDPAADFGAHLVARTCYQQAHFEFQLQFAAYLARKGETPVSACFAVQEVIDHSALLLPELLSDLHREHARLRRACDPKADIKAELEKALELAPDPGRKRAARALLDTESGK